MMQIQQFQPLCMPIFITLLSTQLHYFLPTESFNWVTKIHKLLRLTVSIQFRPEQTWNTEVPVCWVPVVPLWLGPKAPIQRLGHIPPSCSLLNIPEHWWVFCQQRLQLIYKTETKLSDSCHNKTYLCFLWEKSTETDALSKVHLDNESVHCLCHWYREFDDPTERCSSVKNKQTKSTPETHTTTIQCSLFPLGKGSIRIFFSLSCC